MFCTALNSFGKDTEEEPRSFDYTVPQKQFYETNWKRNQDAVCYIKISRIAILTDKIIGNHDLHNSVKRLL